MNAFVTRYRPKPDEAELKKHIDGANVDGSVILALPTDEPFEGGKLKVWDGRPTVLHEYAMAPGDCIFLDARVWHQGCAITSGARRTRCAFEVECAPLRPRRRPRRRLVRGSLVQAEDGADPGATSRNLRAPLLHAQSKGPCPSRSRPCRDWKPASMPLPVVTVVSMTRTSSRFWACNASSCKAALTWSAVKIWDDRGVAGGSSVLGASFVSSFLPSSSDSDDESAGAGAGAGASASACTGFSVGCVWPSDLLQSTSKGIFFKAGCRNNWWSSFLANPSLSTSVASTTKTTACEWAQNMSQAPRQFSLPETSHTLQFTLARRSHRAVADRVIANSTNWCPQVGAVWNSSTPCFLAHFSKFLRTAGTQQRTVVLPAPSKPQISAARVFLRAISAPQQVRSKASQHDLKLSPQAARRSSHLR